MCRHYRRGAAAIEFALVAPLFVLMIFGMIEFGRMAMVQQVLTNASREGARTAVIEGATVAKVTEVVQVYLQSAGLPLLSPGIYRTDGTTDTPIADLSTIGYGDRVKVKVSVPFSQVSWLGSPIPFYTGATRPESTTLSASTVMRAERVP